MRPSITSVLMPFLVPYLVAATDEQTECLQTRSGEMAEAVLCGDIAALRKCFEEIHDASDYSIKDCLLRVGCKQKEAVHEANYLIQFCKGEPEDLKRQEPAVAARADTTTADSGTTTDKAATTDATTAGTTTAAAATTTTAAAATTTAATTTAATTTAASAASTTATTAAVTTAGGTTTSLQCSTMSTTFFSSCDATNTASCTTLPTTTSVCAANMICATDAATGAGTGVCMLREDGLSTSGGAVAIFLAVVVALTIGTISWLCCADRSEQKRMRARAEAAAIAKASSMAAAASAAAPPLPRAASSQGGNPFAG